MTSDLEFARRIALRLLDSRSRSEAELRTKLAAKGVPQEQIDELLGRFREVGLVDDAAYAKALARTRREVNRQGRGRIQQELQRQGLSPEDAEAGLAELDQDGELEAARAFAERRARSLSGLEPHVAKRRLLGALQRRGFSVGVAMQVAREVLSVDDWDDAPDPL